jgi:cysteine synthase A
MTTHGSVIDAIGNTPLIKLKRACEETGCTILGKAAHRSEDRQRH